MLGAQTLLITSCKPVPLPEPLAGGGSYAAVMGAYITGNETIGYDPDAPRVEITSPVSNTVTTTNTSITLQSTASDTQGIVSVTWNNDRGGSGTGWSGAATQNVNWTVSNIPLQSGQNIITVTATDGDNKTGIDTLIVNPTTSSGGSNNNGNSNGNASASGGSGCGFVKDSDGKGQGAKGEGLSLMIMLIITLAWIAISRMNFKRRITTSKAGGKLLKFKAGLIVLTLLFLFVAYTPAHATVYLNLDAEEGTVGTTVSNPPFCQTECSGGGERATYQSSGGAPQGSNYYQWSIAANQPNHYTEVHFPGGPVIGILGRTIYFAFFFNTVRINGQDVWHECSDPEGHCQSGDKGEFLWGDGLRWTVGFGQWQNHYANQDHRYTVWQGCYNSYGLCPPDWPVENTYVQNRSGYSRANPIQLEYERWYSVVQAIGVAADNTGFLAIYIDGVLISEYMGIRTAAHANPTIHDLYLGGTIAQGAYDAPAHYKRFDAFIVSTTGRILSMEVI